jgi:hypothetical protein
MASELQLNPLDTIQQLSYLDVPQLEHPVWGGVALAAGAALVASSVYLGKHTESRFAAQSPDPTLLQDAIISVQGGEVADTSRRMVWPGTLLAGAAIVGASLAASPYTMHEEVNDKARTVVVIGSSYTGKTLDDPASPITRSEAIADAFDSVDYQGRIAIVLAGGDKAALALPLEQNQPEQVITAIENSTVNPNGSDLAGGIELAKTLLPRDEDGKPVGEIKIVTDGIVDNSQAQIDESIDSAEAEGIPVTGVLIGAAEANYSLDGFTQVDSSAQPAIFNALPAENVVRAETPAAISETLSGAMNEAGVTEVREDWNVALWVGGVLSALGLAGVTKNYIGNITNGSRKRRQR